MSGFVLGNFVGKRQTIASSRMPALDGLRGVAAFMVFLFHATTIFNVPGQLPCAHLAVDFFFMLSGFVIAVAYKERLATSLSFQDFFALRMRRIYPMAFMGALLGAIYYLLRWSLSRSFDASWIFMAFSSAAFFLPTAALLRVDHLFYPLNPPQWSLFFELLVNFAYAGMARWLNRPRLIVLCTLSGAALIYAASVNHGFDMGNSTANFLWGFVRVVFPFFAGALLAEIRPSRRINGFSAALLMLLLLCLLALPDFMATWSFEVFAVMILFPATIFLGSICDSGPALTAICLGLGELSYPLYAVHYPVLKIAKRIAEHAALPVPFGIAFIFACAVAVIAAAFLPKLWDRPVRGWLGNLRPARSRGMAKG